MAILIVAGLVVIAAKLVLDLGGSPERAAVGEMRERPNVVHMVGAGDRVVLVIESPSGQQVIRVLDPVTETVTEMSLDDLLN